MCPKVCESYDWSAERETARANIIEDTKRERDDRSPFDRDWARIIHSSRAPAPPGEDPNFRARHR